MQISKGMSDAHHLVLVTVLDINDSQFLYPSCNKCSSKLTEDIDARWICFKCDLTYTKEKLTWRFRVSVRVSDASAVCNVCVFGPTLDQMFGDNAYKFQRNLIKLATEQSNADQIVLGAVQEVFIGNSFYLGIKSTICCGVKPVRLLDIVKCNGDYDTPTLTQGIDSSGTSLVANQIIPVCGKFETNVSSIIRSVLKNEGFSHKNVDSLRNVKPNFQSFVWESLPQEDVFGSSTFSQPTVLLSCELAQQTCEDPDINKHSKFYTSAQDQMFSVDSAVWSKSTEDVPVLQHSIKSVGFNEPVEVSEHQLISLNEEQSRSAKRKFEDFNISKGKENCVPVFQRNNKKNGVVLNSDSWTVDNSTFDLFDSSTERSPASTVKSPSLPCIHPVSLIRNSITSNYKQALPMQVNILQKDNKYFRKDDLQYSGLFSQEIFTPSPVFKAVNSASTNRICGSVKHYKRKRQSSTKFLSFVGRRSISMQAFPLDHSGEYGEDEQDFKDSMGEGSPLLFTDTSCEQSVISPDLAPDISLASKCLSPDIFESTPKQFITKKPALSPNLAKNLFKE